jgi:hypothetical protein
MNKKEILDEIKRIDAVCNSPYNNEGLYNEMRVLKEKLLKKLEILEASYEES